MRTRILIGIASVVGLVAFTLALTVGIPFGTSTTTASSPAVLDANYDEGWVKNIPGTIDGFEVLAVTTPKDKACSFAPTITLKTTRAAATGDDVMTILAEADLGPTVEKIRAIDGVPDNVRVSLVGPSASVSLITTSLANWNESKATRGCPGPWTDTEINTYPSPNAFAIFMDVNAGQYTDDNAQSVYITSPSGVGGQDNYSAALNNVRVNTSDPPNDDVIQVGMHLEPYDTFIGWTDRDHGLDPQLLLGVPYYASQTYWFTLTYTGGEWWACAQDATHSNYACVEVDANGTNLLESDKTSVWFENANTVSDWYNGFPSTMSAYGAKYYRNGTPQNWTSENRITKHNCGDQGTYPVSGAMGSTSLTNGGTGTWTMSGIPIYCP